VWFKVNAWTNGLVQMPQVGVSLERWWNHALSLGSWEHKRRLASLLMYTVWNLWKERNRRIFDLVAATPQTILILIKDEISLRIRVCGDDVLPPRVLVFYD
jgi:hypothetical protein